MSPKPKARLGVRDFAVQVRLGVGADERREAQEVRFNFTFFFPELPPASRSDRIEDTLCYGTICDRARSAATSREFNTIENLALEVFTAVKTEVPESVLMDLQLHKVRPPVPGLEGGSWFEILESGSS